MTSDHEFLPAEGDRDPADFLSNLPDNRECQDAFVVLCDLGPHLNDPVLARLLLERVWWARSAGVLLVLLQRSAELPTTLQDEIATVEHKLPTREESAKAMTDLIGDRFAAPSERHLDNVMGLTSVARDNAVGLAMLDAKERALPALDVKVLRRIKEEEIGKRPYLRAIEPKTTLSDMLGHSLLKDWATVRAKGFTEAARARGIKPPKGMARVGPPGTGKTSFAAALAGSWEMPVLVFDVGAAFGGILGETEQNVADALAVAEACAPCILLVDEVERAFGSGGERDGGTAERILGKFLTWTSQKSSPVFLLFTSNYPERLPAALMRKGRLDEIFFLDLPSVDERFEIWAHYLRKSPIPGDALDCTDFAAASEGWSGAEIEAAVEAATFRAFAEDRAALVSEDVLAEIRTTRPVSESRRDDVAAMRSWAASNARATAAPRAQVSVPTSSKRKVNA
jgi:AAA+ superfamily predicted ATPase